MNAQPSLNINLLKKKGTPTLDLFIHWAITGGRFIVILTETIALAAFLYRFTLDRQIVDLHDKIKAKQVIVGALASQETTYRELQERLQQTKELSDGVSFTPDLITKVSTLAKQNSIVFSTVSLNDDVLHIELTTGTVDNLKQFVRSLQELDELKDISIDRIEDRTTSAELAAVISGHSRSTAKKVTGLTPVVIPEGNL